VIQRDPKNYHSKPKGKGALPGIKYALPAGSEALLELYNDAGDKLLTLANENKKRGSYSFEFDFTSHNLPPGAYYYRLAAFDKNKRLFYVNVEKMTIGEALPRGS